MKKWLLEKPTAANGVVVCTAVAGLALLIGLVIFRSFLGFVIGSIAGAFLWVALWNSGVLTIPVKQRATLIWLGAREKGAEIGEGIHWIFPGMISIGDRYDMREQTLVVPDVPIHTKDKTISKVSISIQWAPKAGQLYYLGDIVDPQIAFDSEIKQVIRAFSVSKGGIDRLIELGAAETLKVTIREYLQRRCAGKASKIGFNAAGIAKYSVDTDTQPWGIEVRSVAVTAFGLDDGVTKAAARTEIARAEIIAAEILRQGVVETVEALRNQGLDPVIALEEGNLLLFPDRASPPVKRWAVTGLDGTIAAMVNGALTALGKSPLPIDVTPNAPKGQLP